MSQDSGQIEISSADDDRKILDRADIFYLEEFKAYRTKIEEHIKEVRQSETYALIGFFIYYAWLFSQASTLSAKPLLFTLSLFPMLIPLMLYVKDRAHSRRIRRIAKYISQLEKEFLHPALSRNLVQTRGFEDHFGGGANDFYLFGRLYYIILMLIVVIATIVLTAWGVK